MSSKRKIEILSARCAACEETLAMVKRIACGACDVEILDMHDPTVAAKAKSYGVRTVPAIAGHVRKT
jgi:glutaredoxin 3